jgi:hypothetical protein
MNPLKWGPRRVATRRAILAWLIGYRILKEEWGVDL